MNSNDQNKKVQPNFNQVFQEFNKIVDAIYGIYLDATTGFHLLKKYIDNSQKHSRRKMKVEQEYLDSLPFFYGEGDPNVSKDPPLHKCTQGELKQRNSENGENFVFIGNMALVSLYQYWEDSFRQKIAESLGISKDIIKCDIMGDVRLIRRSIIHNKGVALPEINKCKLLKWFNPDDRIYIDKEKFKSIVSHVKQLEIKIPINSLPEGWTAYPTRPDIYHPKTNNNHRFIIQSMLQTDSPKF